MKLAPTAGSTNSAWWPDWLMPQMLSHQGQLGVELLQRKWLAVASRQPAEVMYTLAS